MSKSNKNDLLSKWLKKSNAGSKIISVESDNILKSSLTENIPLSYGQKRLWMLQRLNPDNSFYNYAEIYHITGKIDIPLFEKSVKTVIEHHDILRTRFELKNEEPIQIIQKNADFDFIHERILISGDEATGISVKAFKDKIGNQSFDLSLGPLVRIGVLELPHNKYILIVNMHHIITDKWSMRIFREDLSNVYNSLLNGSSIDLTPSKIQFSDFAIWENNKIIDENKKNFWLNELANVQESINFPYDYDRPKVPTYKGAFCTNEIEKVISDQISVLCKRYNVTPFIFYLSVFNILLHKYCRQNDIVVGTPISNRSKSSLERVIGFFNDTIVVRSQVEGELLFSDYLTNLRKNVLRLFEHSDVPFDVLVKELGVQRDPNINPLFQMMFLYHKVPESPTWEGFDITYETLDLGVSKFDLTFYIAEDNGNCSATIEYSTDLLSRKTVERVHQHYIILLQQVIKDPEINLSKLSLSSKEEVSFLYDLNKNDKEYINEGLYDYILNQLNKGENETAVTFGKHKWTYGQLLEAGRKIAFQLEEIGIRKGDVVAVSTNRSVELIGAIVGVLSIGAVYMPVDPNYPSNRINYMLEEAQVSCILCDEKHNGLFVQEAVSILNYEKILNRAIDTSNIRSTNVTGEDIAYLIFTSGSTGNPKGVLVSHANIIHSTLARRDFYTDQPGAFLLLSSFAFDSSMVGLFWTLCSGGNLILAPDKVEQNMNMLGQMVDMHKVSHTLMLPTLYQLLLQQSDKGQLDSLKCVIVAGETCSTKLCQDHFKILPNTKLYNEYGPTEASVWCTGYEITCEDIEVSSIPIGKAISSTDIFILDEYGNLMPRGLPGEIYIGGRGVAKGYINKPNLTKERFIEHTFSQEFPSLIYKTGDLGMMEQDGTIEFLGRVDQQIKIRGFRVELSEIQNKLQYLSEFSEVIVVPIKHENSLNKIKSIIAFYVADHKIDVQKTRGYLSSILPDYMIPSSFIKVEEIPKLPNGKYDHKAFESFDFANHLENESNYVGPTNDVEEALVSIWEEVLDIKPIGIHDNYFSLGGDSILSIQINGKAQKLGLKFLPNEIFKSQTIAELAQVVSTYDEVSKDSIYEGEIKTTPIQRWFLNGFKNNPNHWHLGFRFDQNKLLDYKSIKDSIKIIVERHESLRLVFNKERLHFATVRPYDDCYIDCIQLAEEDGIANEKNINTAIANVCSSTDIEKGPLFKCIYFEHQNTEKSSIVLLAHHLVIDQVSWNILIEELGILISQIKGAPAVQLGNKSISYHSWSNKLDAYTKSTLLNEDMKFWKSEFTNYSSEKEPLKLSYKESDVANTILELDKDLSNTVIYQLTEKYDVKVNELLIFALALAMKKWKDYPTLTLETEGHGRESIDNESTFFNSVGWFTSLYPMFLELDKEKSNFEVLRYIKNKVRSIPQKGLTFGLCKYIYKEGENLSAFQYQADVLINYLGKSMVIENETLGIATALKNNLRSGLSERLHPLEFNVFLKNEQLLFECSYVESELNFVDIKNLFELIKTAIIDISKDVESEKQHNYVPADFQDLDFDEDDLDALFEQL